MKLRILTEGVLIRWGIDDAGASRLEDSTSSHEQSHQGREDGSVHTHVERDDRDVACIAE